MSTCPYCETEIIEGDYFCESCEKQTKCRNCSSMLRPHKTLCLVCGNPLISSETSVVPLNQFSLEENRTIDSYSRRVEVRATDIAIGQLAPLLGGQINVRQVVPPVTPESRPELRDVESLQNGLSSEQRESFEEDSVSPKVDVDLVSHQETHSGRLSPSYFFRIDEENGEKQLVAMVRDYKGKTKKENQKRFILLYVWSYRTFLEKPVPSDKVLINAAQQNGFKDSNFARYLSKTKDSYLFCTSEGFDLNREGHEQVQHIITHIHSVPSTPNSGKQERSRTRQKRARFNGEDEQMIEEWIVSPIDIGGFDVRTLDSPVKQAMFAIWAISKVLGQAEPVKPKVAYSYLTKRFPTVQANSKSFTDCLSRKTNEPFFGRNSEGKYYLKEPAEQQVERWIKDSENASTHTSSIGGHNSREGEE